MSWKKIIKYNPARNRQPYSLHNFSSGYGIPQFVIEGIMEDNKDRLDSDDWNDFELITDEFYPKLEMVETGDSYEIKLTASTKETIEFHSYSKKEVSVKIADFYWKDNSAGDIIVEMHDKLPVGKDFDLDWQIDDYHNKKLIIAVYVSERGG